MLTFSVLLTAAHSRTPVTPASPVPIFSRGGAGQDTARTRGASPVSRALSHTTRADERGAHGKQWQHCSGLMHGPAGGGSGEDTLNVQAHVQMTVALFFYCSQYEISDLIWLIKKSNLTLTFIIRMAIHHLSSIKFIFIRRKWISLPHIKMSGSLTLVWP